MSNTVFDLKGTTLTVKPFGELDSMSVPAFEEELRQHLSDTPNIIIPQESEFSWPRRTPWKNRAGK